MCSLTESGSLLLPTKEILLLAVSLPIFCRQLWEGISQEFTREEYFKSSMTSAFPHPTGLGGFPQSRRVQCGPDLPFSYPTTLNTTGKFNLSVLLDCVHLSGCGGGICGDLCNNTGQPDVLSPCSDRNVQFGSSEVLEGQVYPNKWGTLHRTHCDR